MSKNIRSTVENKIPALNTTLNLKSKKIFMLCTVSCLILIDLTVKTLKLHEPFNRHNETALMRYNRAMTPLKRANPLIIKGFKRSEHICIQ